MNSIARSESTPWDRQTGNRLLNVSRNLVLRTSFCLLLAGGFLAIYTDSVHAGELNAIWIEADATDQDYYVAFRGHFTLDEEMDVEIRTLGASWFVAWMDGQYFTEGPIRFSANHPQYESKRIRLNAGQHIIAAQVHHVGEETRMMPNLPPFFSCYVYVNGQQRPVDWKAFRLPGYQQCVRRISPILGWIEWCDTRQLPADWQSCAFDDSTWTEPVPVKPSIGKPAPSTIGLVQHFEHKLQPMGQGPLANTYGYERDDIPARFFLRDQKCDQVPSQGLWRRYDLGRVRLGYPDFTFDLPDGAIVQFAIAETLSHGRVAPYINLSTGPSCNLDHYVARGGRQTFRPLTPKSGRYLEVHVLVDPDSIRFVEERFIERGYHGQPEGDLQTGDPLLDRIWLTGVETYRACTEDALVDNPTRERGQWTGEVVSVGMDIASVTYRDLRLFRRGLIQAAECAREDGLVAGLSPGNILYMATFACQWVPACVHYYELTGDRAFLEEMYPAALRNLGAFEPFIKENALEDGAGWIFIDWGYVRNEGPADMAYNMHFLAALEAIIRWSDILGQSDALARFEKMAGDIRSNIKGWLTSQRLNSPEDWDKVGYHRLALALSLGLIESSQESACIEAVKRHMMRCFPNAPDAPRLADPTCENPQLITPYFAHFAFPPLIERGEMDYILNQYRTCWGWALGEDRTTWVEVFDTRWSHCHHWAGAPTWQLSRYLLGLHPRFDLGMNHFHFNLCPGSLRQVRGTLPLTTKDGSIRIEWERQGEALRYTLLTDAPLHIHNLPGEKAGHIRTVSANQRHEISIPVPSKSENAAQ
ncbi:MAG: hypothetical protein GXY44_11110 [Phycisphaerales bacterium]|nr:hypothetical protein [Phycisphaerales bacterium]